MQEGQCSQFIVNLCSICTVLHNPLAPRAGCDPVVVGNLATAAAFAPGGLGWWVHLTAPELRRRLGLPING